jgi:glucose 1-dehydrogenase
MQLEGKTAIVTGSDSGIGQAIAELFAKQGADVCVCYHTDSQGAAETQRRVEAAGRRALVMQVDITEWAQVARLFDYVATEWAVPDLLLANAGIGGGLRAVTETEPADIERIVRTNLFGPFYCAAEFVRRRQQSGGRGRLVFTSSVAGQVAMPQSAVYAMCKAAVDSLVRTLSAEVAKYHINVNAVAPGLVVTPMTKKLFDDPHRRDQVIAGIPWHRPAQPQEIAELALFLASDAAEYITGQVVAIDGGLATRRVQ